MKIQNFAATIIVATTITAMTTPVMSYEAGDVLIRGRMLNISPSTDSGSLFVGTEKIGKGVVVNDDAIPELDITYMFSPQWGVELILGYSEHTIRVNNKVAAAISSGSRDVINTKVLPPTLTLQYHFLTDSFIRPYIGAGINYTHFFDEQIPSDSGASKKPEDGDDAFISSSVQLRDSWGLAAQAGVDISLNPDWFVNLDVKYIDMDTQAKFKNIVQGDSADIDTGIDPFVFGIGIGRRF